MLLVSPLRPWSIEEVVCRLPASEPAVNGDQHTTFSMHVKNSTAENVKRETICLTHMYAFGNLASLHN